MSGDLSVAQLQRMLESKQTMLTQLMRKRERLHRDLQQVEEKILSVGGGAAVRKGNKGRKRPKNDKTLCKAVIEVLGETKKGWASGNRREGHRRGLQDRCPEVREHCLPVPLQQQPTKSTTTCRRGPTS